MKAYLSGTGGKKTKNGEKYLFEFETEFWKKPRK
jgi:hypothetical protein